MKKVVSVLIIGILLCSILFLSAQAKILSIAELKNKVESQEISDASSLAKTIEQKCGTMKILTEREKQNNPALEIRIESNPVFPRPTDPSGDPIDGEQHLLPQLYNTTHFILHWTNGSDGGNSTDAATLNYVEIFAAIFENVWNFEVVNLGFQAPPSDVEKPNDLFNSNPDSRYDVFVYNMYYYGYCDCEQWSSSSYGYIAVENDYLGFSLQGIAAMQITGAHEFFHAIQFGYDCYEERWWMETTATYMEDEVYPDINDNYQFIPSWFLFSDALGLETYDWENATKFLHAYGNFIFAKRLSEDFGDVIIKEIWQEMRNTNGLAAVNNTLVSKNSSLVDEFGQFVVANFFLEESYQDGAGYRNALRNTPYKGVWLEYEYDAATASNFTEINSTNVSRNCWMDKWACDYVSLKLDPTKPRYLISFDGLDVSTNYIVKLATKKDGVISSETPFPLNAQKDGSIELVYDDFQNVTLIIANAGNTTTANPSWRVIIEQLPEIPTVYDVAVIDLQSSTNYAFPEDTINIYVTVKNKGTARNEDFNTSIYWGQLLVETREVTGLAPTATEILNIAWTIPSELEGSERVWANATITPDETNKTNNVLEDGMLTIMEEIHDVAVEDIVVPKTVIGQGQSLGFNVTISNKGTFPETTNLTALANASAIQTKIVTILVNTSLTITFQWDTAGVNKGNYTISAYAEPVPGETDTADNTYIYGIVSVVVPGDVNGDGIVDIMDILMIAKAYGSYPGHPRYNPNLDINCDGKIDIKDIFIAAKNYGKTNP